MNSCTSRPRSPINPITAISHFVLRASMDISTDLPTPDPEKIPMRWPSQQVTNVLSALTPRSSGGPTRCLSEAGGGALRSFRGTSPFASSPFPSIGSPSALTTLPSQALPGCTTLSRDLMTALHPIRTPSSPENGMQSACPSLKPTTSAGTFGLSSPLSMKSREPTLIS